MEGHITSVEWLYAAGRLGEGYHQAIGAAGTGAEGGITGSVEVRLCRHRVE
ncbi:hypothetical protein [Halolamina sp.]|uniref:hypothetical protein n=1 Tax=Halolamina sp. TaxID=1940283 RepID=UPI0012FD8046